MKTTRTRLILALASLASLNCPLSTVHAQGTAFTYQGRLNVNGSPASGSYDFRFRLAVDPYGDNYFRQTNLSGQAVSDGLFVATLDFGAGAFNGSNYWLEIAVRTNGAGPYTTLNPLQPVLPAPYAVFSGSAATATSAASATTAANFTGPLAGDVTGTQGATVVQKIRGVGVSVTAPAANQYLRYDGTQWAPGSVAFSGTVADSNLSANVALLNAKQTFSGSNLFSGVASLTNTANTFVGTFSGDGAGLTSLNPSKLSLGTAAINISGNAATATSAASATTATTFTGPLAGDVAGTQGATVVQRIRGVGVSATAPAANQYLRYDGTQWAPGSVAFSGTVADSNLSANVALLNAKQTFSGSNLFSGVASLTNPANSFVGTFSGNGAGLASLNPANLSSGTAAINISGSAATATSAATANTANGVAPNSVTSAGLQDSAVTSAKIASGQVIKSLTAGANTLYDNVTLAAGNNVTITPSGQTVTIAASAGGAAGWALNGNAGTTPAANFVGTTDNQPVEVRVNDQRALRLEPASYGAPNILGGASVNLVPSGVRGATIGGGGSSYFGWTNSVTSNYGTVGGGSENTAGGVSSTVSGGVENNAGGPSATVSGGYANAANGDSATVGGGHDNSAGSYNTTVSGGAGNTANSFSATVGGGSGNTASSGYATVSGGQLNQATGNLATVPGGWRNIAGGAWSFAAGGQAQALHDGAFVWSDGTALTASTADNQFVVRASGGAFIYSPSGARGVVWTSENDGPGTGLDADTVDGYHASDLLTSGGAATDYGRSNVAADLFEGPTKLGDKYLSKTGPGTISSASSLATLQVTNTWTGHGVYVESSTSTDNGTALKAWVKGTTGNTFGVWGLTGSDAIDGNPGSSAGVYGKSTRTGPVGDVFGVLGEIHGAGGAGTGDNLAAGVYGVSYASSGKSVGVAGDSASREAWGAGVFGMNKSPIGNTRGVWGEVSSPTGKGVYGRNPSSTGYGVYSEGRFEVAASFSALADSWSTRSSKRWKTEITPIEGALDIVEQLRGVRFEWTETGKRDVGLIAEEVGEVLPEIVQYEENGKDARSVDCGRIVSVLIEAVKEQQREIDTLRREVDSLKQR
jgi:hypothetical protein